ncbi:lysoplasmalogenase [Christensenellaceae bacterium OttesenSCG-928-K19]|nr:lysoplasmalogenase [Christensenellaceae bacterium OttesenSCG-928-K19]
MDWITGNYITVAIVIAFAVILVLYLFAEKKNDGKQGFKKATALKLTLSSLFCAVGIISYYLLYTYAHRGGIYLTLQVFVVVGLFVALGGDFFLQYIRLDIKKFKIGILCFSITQVLFLIPMLVVYRVGWLEFVITAVVLVLVLLMMKKQDWQLGEAQKALTVYTILITFMAAKSVTVFLGDHTVGTLLFMIGAILFLVSDLLLGIWNYNTSKRAHANLNWISYFSGLMLIALSMSPEFTTYLG